MKLKILSISYILTLAISFYSLSHAVISSPNEAEETRKSARALYAEKKYSLAEDCWKQVLSSEFKVESDIRAIASVHQAQKKFRDALSDYSELLHNEDVEFSDSWVLITVLFRLAWRKEDLREYKDVMLRAYDVVMASPHGGAYERDKAGRVLNYFQKLETENYAGHLLKSPTVSPINVQ